MRRHLKRMVSLLSAAILATLPGLQSSVLASSHREAPFITEHPKLDGTDFYMFRSYETGRSDFVTLIANFMPLQDAYGGPNYFTFDPDAIYEIHIENTGDAVEDITFQFKFTNTLANSGNGLALDVNGTSVGVALRNIGTISASDTSNLNEVETYTVTKITGDRRGGTRASITNASTGSSTFTKPYDYVGDKTFTSQSGYESYANSFIYDIAIPGCSTNGKLFVGQRDEAFNINLGEVFDLVNLNPTGSSSAELNIIDNKNVTSLALEVPISCLVGSNSTVIAGWFTSSLPQARVLNPAPDFSTGTEHSEGGAFVQVSRLGMPLVNELIIGLKDKNKFNGSEPKDDSQFATFVTNPTFPEILQILFGVTAPNLFPRVDLVNVFLTGVTGVNAFGNQSYEAQRLNTGVAVTARASQNRLGAALCFDRSAADATTKFAAVDLTASGCDPAGFPNGRRPGDDVVDIELTVLNGFLLASDVAPSGSLVLTDGATLSASELQNSFPYLNTPNAGSPAN